MGRCYRRRKELKKNDTLYNINLKSFYKWIATNECKFKGLKIKNFIDTGHGLLAKRRFYIGDIILEIPFNLLITKSHIKTTYLAPLLDYMNLNESDILTIFLFCEKLNHNSYFHDYLSTLPVETNMPIVWSNEEIKKINAMFYEEVVNQKRKICKLWTQFINGILNLKTKLQTCDPLLHKLFELISMSKLIKKLPCNGFNSLKSIRHLSAFIDIRMINFEENLICKDEDLWGLFIWSWAMVNSRIICLNRKTYEDIDNCVLAPFLDLLNHSPLVKTEVIFNEEKQLFILKTLTKIRKNTQIFINYGPHDNLNLLLHYGFIIQNNPHDVFAWNFNDVLNVFDVHKLQSDFYLKFNYIQEKNLNKYLFCNNEELSWNLLKILQIFLNPFEQLNENSIYGKNKENDDNAKFVLESSLKLIHNSLSNLKIDA